MAVANAALLVDHVGAGHPLAWNVAARHVPGEGVPRTHVIDQQGRIRYRYSSVPLKWALRGTLETPANEPAPQTSGP